jgi:transposase
MVPGRPSYPTDLSDTEWELLAPVIPAPKPGGRPVLHERRDIINALAYWMRTGCAWRLLSHDFPPWQRVYHYWRLWRIEGCWEQILDHLRRHERIRNGRDPTPSAGIIDFQSVKATDRGGSHGYDGGKKVNGIKPHLLVDTMGNVLTARVSPANAGDRQGAMVLLSLAAGLFLRLRHVWADQGYRGQALAKWARRVVDVTVQIVQRSDGGFRRTWAPQDAPAREGTRFAVVPRRWVVERTFAWLGKYRRTSKDYEYLAANSENVIYLAMSMTLLHRLARTPP